MRHWLDIQEIPGYHLEITQGFSEKVLRKKAELAKYTKAQKVELKEESKPAGILEKIFGREW